MHFLAKALETSDMQLLFDTIKLKRYPIESKAQKTRWKLLYEQLMQARKQKTIDMLNVVIKSELIPIPQNVLAYYMLYFSAPDVCYCNTTIKDFLDLEYEQFLSAIRFCTQKQSFQQSTELKAKNMIM